MITRSKKTRTTSEKKHNFDHIPLDLVIDIIGRLPAKSLARFLIVSKSWETIIRSRDFITSYPLGSSSSTSQPRLLIAFSDFERRIGRQNWYFFSSTSSSTSFLSRLTCPLPNPEGKEYPSHYVNGLISLGYGREQIICNPTSGKSIPLPRVKTRRRIVKSFFGYDSVNDQYKVLCMTEKLYGAYRDVESSQHQVRTLGARKPSWRMIDCSVPHRPWSNGVCIEGVVYYLAHTGAGLSQMSLMRFDLRSEKLDLFAGLSALNIQNKLLYDYTLLNYQGKLALVTTKPSLDTFDVWVREKHGWLKKSFSIGTRKSLRVTGITRMGEIILVPYYTSEFCVILYDLNRNSLRNIKVEVNPYYKDMLRSVTRAYGLSDYDESIRFF